MFHKQQRRKMMDRFLTLHARESGEEVFIRDYMISGFWVDDTLTTNRGTIVALSGGQYVPIRETATKVCTMLEKVLSNIVEPGNAQNR